MTVKRKKIAFYTLGCRVNQYETRAVEEAFLKQGFEIGQFDDVCDVYIINTCTVTAESDRKSCQMIRRAKKTGGEHALVGAMGCMVQVTEKDLKALGLDFAVGSRDKLSVVEKTCELLADKGANVGIHPTDFDVFSEMEKMSVNGSDNTRAFLKISDGCQNNCSYCIIPKARGPVCSKKQEDVCQEVKTLVQNGLREVVLTGIETAAYGKDTGTDLPTLIEAVSTLDEPLYRIRLGSLEPTVVKEAVAKRFGACPKLMPHFHLSLQSGSDSVLAAMRRKYNTQTFDEVIDRLRRHVKDVTFTTDIIVGFPGETEEMFLETCEYVQKCRFLFVHIFPYSDRQGTDASRMPGKLDEKTKKERAARLKEVMLETRKSVLEDYLDTVRPVLVETVKDGIAAGHTDNFIEMQFDVPEGVPVKPNDLVDVKLVKPGKSLLFVTGELVQDCPL